LVELEILLERRSIRKFKSKPVPRTLLEKILRTAQRAPTSCGIQAYSFIEVEDPEVRCKIADVIGMQRAMEQAPVWIFVAIDFHRLYRFFDRLGLPIRLGPLSRLVTGLVDASLAAENITIAAEALGLGSVFIGSVWGGLVEIAQILKLPPNCMPALLICLGYPDGRPALRPRWPLKAVHHRDSYRDLEEAEIDDYYRSADAALARSRYFGEGVSNMAEHYAVKFKNVDNWDESLARALRRLSFLF